MGDSASLDTTLSNAYLSLSLKPHLPIGTRFQLCCGAGADLYYTLANFTGSYQRNSATVSFDESQSYLSFGAHGMEGVEMGLRWSLSFRAPFGSIRP